MALSNAHNTLWVEYTLKQLNEGYLHSYIIINNISLIEEEKKTLIFKNKTLYNYFVFIKYNKKKTEKRKGYCGWPS